MEKVWIEWFPGEVIEIDRRPESDRAGLKLSNHIEMRKELHFEYYHQEFGERSIPCNIAFTRLDESLGEKKKNGNGCTSLVHLLVAV